jgi:hypothetical protein
MAMQPAAPSLKTKQSRLLSNCCYALQPSLGRFTAITLSQYANALSVSTRTPARVYKMKFSLEEEMKARRRTRGRDLLCFNFGTRRRQVVNATPRQIYTEKEIRLPIVQESGWAPGPVWTGAENHAPTGIRLPDRPTRSDSLYPLRYPGSVCARARVCVCVCACSPPQSYLIIFADVEET